MTNTPTPTPTLRERFRQTLDASTGVSELLADSNVSYISWLETELASVTEQERVEEQLRIALDGHPESELWGENGLIAATMRAANYASRQREAEWKLADYLRGGGMLSEPADDGDVWEVGRSLLMCYCIDGQGRTILECVESISDAVMEEISSENDLAHTTPVVL